MAKFFDILGNEMEVGDIVAVAATSGQSGELRLGRVTELIEKSYKVRTEWTVGFSGYGNRKETLIQGHDERIQTGVTQRNGYDIPVWTPTGNVNMNNFLCLHKARDYNPED